MNLVDAWQWVQHTTVRLRVFEHVVAEHIRILHSLVFFWVWETLALDAGHVDDVGMWDGIFQLGVLVIFQICILDVLLHDAWKFQFDRRNEVDYLYAEYHYLVFVVLAPLLKKQNLVVVQIYVVV